MWTRTRAITHVSRHGLFQVLDLEVPGSQSMPLADFCSFVDFVVFAYIDLDCIRAIPARNHK